MMNLAILKQADGKTRVEASPQTGNKGIQLRIPTCLMAMKKDKTVSITKNSRLKTTISRLKDKVIQKTLVPTSFKLTSLKSSIAASTPP